MKAEIIQLKAKELVGRNYCAITGLSFGYILENWDNIYYSGAVCSADSHWKSSKQCALIAVDQIIDIAVGSHDDNMKEWWQQVKEEIEKL